MMSRTHMVIGVAASLAVLQPETALECTAAVVGGALGATISDIDVLWKKRMQDVISCMIWVALLIAGLLILEHVAKIGMAEQLAGWVGENWIGGVALLSVVCVCGFFSEHRSFTHSLLGMVLFSYGMQLLLPGRSYGFVVGFATHILLDLMNRKELRLMYPFRQGFCMHLCAASGKVNMILMWLGMSASIVLLTRSIAMWGIGAC